MSEAADGQPVADAPIADAGTGAEASAAAPSAPAGDEDLDTEAYDRAPAPDDDEGGEGADTGQPDAPVAAAAPGEDDDEEVELSDGRKVKVPKEVALGNMRDADYRQKTQALAETRRAFETEKTQQLESLTSLRAEHIAVHQAERQLTDIDASLAEYRKLTPQDWANLKVENTAAFDTHMSNYDILRATKLSAQETLDAAKATLKEKETSLTKAAEEARTANLRTAWGEANVVLTKEIPGWGVEKFKEIGAYATKHFGVTAEQLQNAPDPVPWQMANQLMQLEAKLAKAETAQTQAKAAATTAKAAEVVPAAKPAGGAAKPSGLSDKISTEEWMRRANAREARRRAS